MSRQAARGGLVTLVLGGARSGKSRQAVDLAMQSPPPWVMIATAEARDQEMQRRIARHREERGPGWLTVEAPIDVAGAVAEAPAVAALVVDCLTLWLSNLMLGGHDIDQETARLGDALAARRAPTILVGNEVGLGIVPDTALGRDFRDRAGALNQNIGARADRVVLMVAGIPMTVKGSP
jgi:adenosylcobinamide kinase/adenosylcobinamide-phosphate guanylyltransferase